MSDCQLYCASVFLVAAFLLSSNQTSLNAQDAPRPQQRSAAQVIERIMQSDKNGDGQISRDEARPQLKRAFDRLDKNGDDLIDREELRAIAALIGRNARGDAAAAQPQRKQRAAVPDTVTLITDVPYRKGNKKWTLDLAMPKQVSETSRPAILFVHGGGWRSGDKGGGQWRSLPLQYAARGYVCVSVNYRLADEVPISGCIQDVKCAVRWLRANADKYQVDPKRLGAYGNSAGAHLVAMLGLAGPEAKLEGDGPHQKFSSLVQAVCCSAPPTDFPNWGKRMPANTRGGIWAGPADSLAQRQKQASPITYVRADAPPFLIVHGTADKTVPYEQGKRFADALKKAGAKDVTLLTFEGAGHGVFGQKSRETYPAMQAFFERTLIVPRSE